MSFSTLCPPGTNAKFVLRLYVFLCCASLFSYYCPVLLLTGSLSCWQLVIRVKLSFTLASVHCWLLPCSQQASPPKSLLLDMFFCMMSTQFFGHSLLHVVVLVAGWSWCEEQDEKCHENSFKSSCSSVHKEEQDTLLMMRLFPKEMYLILCSA